MKLGSTVDDGRGVSVAIIAQDEEANIADCLASVGWADEVVVVDGGSRDRTAEIAADMGAHVRHNPWPGFSQQWDLAISLANRDWVFLLAADERVTDELAQEIVAMAAGDNACDGYRVPRQTYFLDRAMRGCGWSDQLELRLFRRGHGRMDGRLVHEQLIVDGRVGVLTGGLTHYSHPSVRDYIANLNRCTSLEAEEALTYDVHESWLPPFAALWRAGRRWLRSDRSYGTTHTILKSELKNRVVWLPLQPLAPLLRFVQMYFVQRGYLDGRHGLYLSLLSGMYVFVKQVKRWELLRKRAGRAVGIEVTGKVETHA